MSNQLCIVAGAGHLPVDAAQAARIAGFDVSVIRLPGAAPELADLFPSTAIALDGFGDLFDWLSARDCNQVSLIGRVIRQDHASVDTARLDPKSGSALLDKGSYQDTTLQSWVIEILENSGLTVLGARDAYPSLLAGEGFLVKPVEPAEDTLSDLRHAQKIATEIGRLDIGQAVISARGVVLAVEAQEGTDAMLQRLSGLPNYLIGTSNSRRGVLFKALKPHQDPRLDLPVIGPRTVELAANAGLAGIGVTAGAALIDDKERTLRAASDAGLFVVGCSHVECT